MKTTIHFWSYLAHFFLECEMFQEKKRCRENQNTHFVLCTFFPPENHAVSEIMLKNIIERGRPQMTIWRMRIECWIPKATDTHSGFVILFAFPLQLWLHQRASVLRYIIVNYKMLWMLHGFSLLCDVTVYQSVTSQKAWNPNSTTVET